MERYDPIKRTRREMLQAAVAMPAAFVLASYASLSGEGVMPRVFAQAPVLVPTPACADMNDATLRQTEGPITSDAPQNERRCSSPACRRPPWF
jgi:hypothetical protein